MLSFLQMGSRSCTLQLCELIRRDPRNLRVHNTYHIIIFKNNPGPDVVGEKSSVVLLKPGKRSLFISKNATHVQDHYCIPIRLSLQPQRTEKLRVILQIFDRSLDNLLPRTS